MVVEPLLAAAPLVVITTFFIIVIVNTFIGLLSSFLHVLSSYGGPLIVGII